LFEFLDNNDYVTVVGTLSSIFKSPLTENLNGVYFWNAHQIRSWSALILGENVVNLDTGHIGQRPYKCYMLWGKNLYIYKFLKNYV
jgi:hypothetical protein